MEYPNWICHECGMKYGRREPGSATWHTGKCDVCGEERAITQPRDFGHLVGHEIMQPKGKKRR